MGPCPRSHERPVVNIIKVIALGSMAAWYLSSVAFAVSITNRDDHDQKVTIIEGAANKDQVLKPEGTIEGVCLKGCVVRLNDSEDDEYELEGNEVVSIEDGYLYYDGPDAGAETAPSDGKAAGSKK